jgi:hypothetical protein
MYTYEFGVEEQMQDMINVGFLAGQAPGQYQHVNSRIELVARAL